MTAFKTEAETEIQEQIDAYVADADKQEHKARATFLALIESSMVKLHGLTNITGLERNIIAEAIINKRDAFGDEVMSWATALENKLTAYKT